MNLKQFCKIKKKIKNGVFEDRKVNRKLFTYFWYLSLNNFWFSVNCDVHIRLAFKFKSSILF